MGAVRVLGVPYSCSVAWRLVHMPYSVGRTRALRCIVHVHVLVALDAAAPPLRNHGVGASWTLLGGCSRMLLVALVRHVVNNIGSVRCAPMAFPVVFGHPDPFDLQKARGAVVRPIASMLPVKHPQLSTFRSRQNSTAVRSTTTGLFGVPTATPPAHRAASKTPRPTSC